MLNEVVRGNMLVSAFTGSRLLLVGYSPSKRLLSQSHGIRARPCAFSVWARLTQSHLELVRAAERKGVDRDLANRVIDIAEKAEKGYNPVASEFLKPPEYDAMLKVLKKFTQIRAVAWGGYPQAERRLIAVSRARSSDVEVEETNVQDAASALVQPFLAVLHLRGNFLFDSHVTHRDFLGSILSSGIKREKVGDILVLGDRGAQVIVMKEAAECIRSSVSLVNKVPVVVEEITFDALEVKEPTKKLIVTVESSMRLDAVSSAGFGISRNKLAQLIKGGSVQVNWREVTTPGKTLHPKDLVVVRGKGRLEVGDVYRTAKGRYRINLLRFV